MRIAIVAPDGVMAVNGVWRPVDLTGLDARIQALRFDVAAGVGEIQYRDDATVQVEARDQAAEDAAWAEVRAAGTPEGQIVIGPIYKTLQVRLPSRVITEWSQLAEFVARWRAAAPLPPPEPTAEELATLAALAARRAAFDTEAAADAFIDQLRGAAPEEIKAWVQANVADLASARAVLGRLAVAVAYALNGGRGK